MTRTPGARGRQLGPRWSAPVACGIALVVGLSPLTAPATAAVPTFPTAVASVIPSTDLRTSDVAATLRSDVAGLLQDYLSDYGDRFTKAERNTLLTYKADADRQSAAVVSATRRMEQAAASGASLAVRRARGASAQAAWRRAKAIADSSFASARQILEPKLSLIELLSAARDYNAMMGRFDDLGAQIDVAAARASRSQRSVGHR